MPCVVGQHAVYNRPVATRDRVVCKLHGKRLMGGVVFTDDDGAGFVSLSILWTIPGRSTPLMPRKLSATAVQYGVDEGVAVMPGRRMDDHILWLC